MERKIRWGIIGPGRIANAFAEALCMLPDAEIAAVASRNMERAREFGSKYGIERIYDSYTQLAEDKDIDAVYIATPHSYHKDAAIICLNRGKAVLCEKPIGINEKELLEMSQCAQKNRTFLMEAMWTRFLPVIKEVRSWIENGLIGDVRLVKANFGFNGDTSPEGRLQNPRLAGGALLDIGIYPINLAAIVYNEKPTRIISIANMSKTGVDEEGVIAFRFGSDKMAEMSISIRNYIPNDGLIIGTKGIIRIPQFFMAQAAFIEINGKEQKEIKIPFMCNGYEYEAVEVMNCIRQGRLESSIMPLDESLRVLRIMDDIRSQWGFKYPGEQ